MSNSYDPFADWINCVDCQAYHPPGKHRQPLGPEPIYTNQPPNQTPRTVQDLLGSWTNAKAARPEVELSAERRAHVGRWAAELKEWKANGASQNEALQLVAMEMQLEFRQKHQGGGS